jgi:hypothetical protein
MISMLLTLGFKLLTETFLQYFALRANPFCYLKTWVDFFLPKQGRKEGQQKKSQREQINLCYIFRSQQEQTRNKKQPTHQK